MTNSEMIVLFALAMLALALVAIGVDWVGKPIHRRFVAKIYRYPEELAPPPDPSLTQWSADTFQVPENPPDDTPIAYVDGSTEWTDAALVIPEPSTAGAAPSLFAEVVDSPMGDGDADDENEPVDASVVAATQAPVSVSPPDDRAAPVVDDQPDLPKRGNGWKPGQYVFNRTRDGHEPSPAAVRKRFWKNVGSSDHVAAFGAANAARLAAGQAPVRRNARTGVIETMTLPVSDYSAAAGKAPSPSWDDDAVDPYAVS